MTDQSPPQMTASPEEIINEARNGRMFILVDNEDRENEGDLILPAQMATPDAINFMALHGRGLICLALTKQRTEQLQLGLQSTGDASRFETAFTVSIESRSGVSTGISAADRARTILVAIDPNKGRNDLSVPGHVFPLIAREGGVLVRPGHTEAAVDVARLAGLNPAGVICEIMNDDGTMARRDDLQRFARLHGLKIGTIRDLVAHRLRHDHLVERLEEIQFTSEWGGDWRAIIFWNKASGMEQIALQKGTVDPARPTLVRMHALSPLSDVFGEAGQQKSVLSDAMRIIGEEGAGIIVTINRPMIERFSREIRLRKADAAGGDRIELKDYGTGAMILAELGVHAMTLLTNNQHALSALEGYGLTIAGTRPIAQ